MKVYSLPLTDITLMQSLDSVFPEGDLNPFSLDHSLELFCQTTLHVPTSSSTTANLGVQIFTFTYKQYHIIMYFHIHV